MANGSRITRPFMRRTPASMVPAMSPSVSCFKSGFRFVGRVDLRYSVDHSHPEHHETAPLCSYGIHKRAIEQYLHLYQHLYCVDYAVLRISNRMANANARTPHRAL